MVISGEGRTAQWLIHRGVLFAATDRSHKNAWSTGGKPGPPVGAVIGREEFTARWLTHRGVLFAATDRSHRDLLCAGQ